MFLSKSDLVIYCFYLDLFIWSRFLNKNIYIDVNEPYMNAQAFHLGAEAAMKKPARASCCGVPDRDGGDIEEYALAGARYMFMILDSAPQVNINICKDARSLAPASETYMRVPSKQQPTAHCSEAKYEEGRATKRRWWWRWASPISLGPFSEKITTW
jgi:hypothetical protein